MTVAGPITPQNLGTTLMHEHLLFDFTSWLMETSESSKMALRDAPVTIDILGRLRRDGAVCKDNLQMLDVEDCIAELMKFKAAGGKSIVDVTPIGHPPLGRSPRKLKWMSEATGLNVVCATGWYMERTHPAWT